MLQVRFERGEPCAACRNAACARRRSSLPGELGACALERRDVGCGGPAALARDIAKPPTPALPASVPSAAQTVGEMREMLRLVADALARMDQAIRDR